MRYPKIAVCIVMLTAVFLLFFPKYKQEERKQSISGGIKTNTESVKRPIILQEVNLSAYQLCLGVLKKSVFLLEPKVEFYVQPDLGQMAVTIANESGPSWIYFHPLSLAFDRQDFEALIAHELGHIYCKCGDGKDEDQIRADQFAVRVVGRDIMRSFLINYGLAPTHPRIIALSQ